MRTLRGSNLLPLDFISATLPPHYCCHGGNQEKKLTSQEMIILSALDHLDKTKEISSDSEDDSEDDEK